MAKSRVEPIAQTAARVLSDSQPSDGPSSTDGACLPDGAVAPPPVAQRALVALESGSHQPGTALVPAGDLSDTTARVTGTPLSLRSIHESHGWIATSIDPSDEAGILDVWAAREDTSETAKDWLNRPFVLRDWVQYVATKQDEETGELITRVVTVLITDAGERISTWAPQVARSLGTLCQLTRSPRGPCNRTFIIKAHKSRNNPGDWYCLTLVR